MSEIKYTLQEKDLSFFNNHQFMQTAAAKKAMRRHYATIPAFIGLIMLFVWFYLQDTLTAMWLAIGGVTWGFGAPLMIRWGANKRAMALYKPEDLKRVLGTYTLRVDPNELVEISAAGESRIAWKDVLRIEPAKNYAFIFVSIDSAIIIPRKSVIEGDLLAFYKEVESHIESAS
jgi:YcxB-like protein